MAPRWSQDRPKMAQDGPKMAQDGTKTAQDGPKPAPRRPKTAPLRPKFGQVACKLPSCRQVAPMLPASCSKMPPKWAEIGQDASLEPYRNLL